MRVKFPAAAVRHARIPAMKTGAVGKIKINSKVECIYLHNTTYLC